MRSRVIIAGLLIGTSVALAEQQTTPPPPAAPRQAALPKPVEKTLENGLRVIVVPKAGVPLVSARVLVMTGSERDTAPLAGLATITASLVTQGTKSRSAEQIARGVEALGARLHSSAGWDASTVDVNVMSSRFEEAMTFVADVVRNPLFKQEEIDRVRAQAIDAVQVSLQDPAALARHVASRVIFPGQPYGSSESGTPETLQRIQREQIAAFHQKHYRPDNAVLVMAGDIKPAAAFSIAEKVFGSWSGGARRDVVTVELRRPVEPVKPRVVVIDMPDAGQAAVLVTRRGLSRVDPHYYPALVTNSILGGSYSARLNQEIRIKRGLSYGANSTFDLRREPGPFVAATQTKNESAAEVAGIIVDELKRLATADVAEAEIVPRKAVLTGSFSRSLETTDGIVARVGALALHDLPLAELGRYMPGVQGVTSEAVKKFAESNLASGTSIVIVGDAKQFLDALRSRFGAVEVIPAAELDLESPALRIMKDAA